jgi:hypothetical protein
MRAALARTGGYRRTVDDDPGTDDEPTADADGDDEGVPFERPVDRFRKGAVGTVMAAGLLGLADALEARPPKEEIVIVQEAPAQPVHEPRRLELLLDPDHPERSMVFLPAPTEAGEPSDGSA